MIKKYFLFVLCLWIVPLLAMEQETESYNNKVTYINLSHQRELKDLEFLKFFPNLKELDLAGTDISKTYKDLKFLSNIETLNLFYTNLSTVNFLKYLPQLKTLKISLVNISKAIKYIKELSSLEELQLVGGYIKGIENIGSLTNLKKLGLRGVFIDQEEEALNQFPGLDFLKNLNQLTELDLSSNDYIFFINPITHLSLLKKLNLSGTPNIKDMRKLKKIKSLEELDVSHIDEFYNPTLINDLIKVLNSKTLKLLIISPNILITNPYAGLKIEYK